MELKVNPTQHIPGSIRGSFLAGWETRKAKVACTNAIDRVVTSQKPFAESSLIQIFTKVLPAVLSLWFCLHCAGI